MGHCLPGADAGDGAHCLQEAVEVVTHSHREGEVEEDAAAYLQAGVGDQVDIAHSHLKADAVRGGATAYLLENVHPFPREDVAQISPLYPQGDEVTRCLLEGVAGVNARARYLPLEVDAEMADIIRSLPTGGVAETSFHFHPGVVEVGDVIVLSHQMTEGDHVGLVEETVRRMICWTISNRFSPSSPKCTI